MHVHIYMSICVYMNSRYLLITQHGNISTSLEMKKKKKKRGNNFFLMYDCFQ